MAHHTEKAGFPDLHLSPGMQIQLVAQNPTTDAAVAGVTSTRWAIYGYDESEEVVPAAPGLEILELPARG